MGEVQVTFRERPAGMRIVRCQPSRRPFDLAPRGRHDGRGPGAETFCSVAVHPVVDAEETAATSATNVPLP
jgi:hypothetical protein